MGLLVGPSSFTDQRILPVLASTQSPRMEPLVFFSPSAKVVRNRRSPQTAMPLWPALGSVDFQTMFWFSVTLQVVGASFALERQVPSGPPAWGQFPAKRVSDNRAAEKVNRFMECASKWMISCRVVSAKVSFAMTACRFILSLTLGGAWHLPPLTVKLPNRLEYFERNVRPVLVANCQPCHNMKTKSSGLDLSSAAGFTAGGAGGTLIARDQPEYQPVAQGGGATRILLKCHLWAS